MKEKAARLATCSVEELFRLHHPRLCQLAYTMVRDREVARDLVQDVFFKLLLNQQRVELGDKIGHYLSKATAHAALNYLEKSRRNIPLSEEASHSALLLADEVPLEAHQLADQIEKALESLPPKCRSIFLLSRQQGFTYGQIAEHLGLSTKTVDNQMGIALQKLRQQLKPLLSREWLLTGLAAGCFFSGQLMPLLSGSFL